MTGFAPPERVTQARVADLLEKRLDYDRLGDWRDRAGNSNIETGLLTAWLRRRGHSDIQINRAIDRLKAEADHPARELYDSNKAVWSLLRYGVRVQSAAGENYETVQLIDWNDPHANHFAFAEEVTLTRGGHERRPDLVLYVNGIAVAVIELKNSRISLSEGIRQLLSNQTPAFNAWFFSTVQVCFAGNDSEGLRYGTTGTPETFYQSWKEDEEDNAGFKLDKYLLKLCDKARLIELMRDFVLFDAGRKKLPRPHQYFAVKAAQTHVGRGEGGIIWHTQGSGKSITMVLLARWILANRPNARVAIITDRDELDKQIHGVFTDSGETIHKARSGRDLITQLGQARPRLLCSLVHKFGRRDVDDFDAFIEGLGAAPVPVMGELFVFVDECHRTQSGKLHRLMKAILPGATFIGFTGTPLLKKDRDTSREVFGDYIHTYKFGEAVEDGIVLDLVYEARDIDQRLASPGRVDDWFEAKTRELNDWQKTELQRRWAVLREVLSSRMRKDQIVSDILFDFATKPRLASERGNAMLVAGSIRDACKYYELFQKTALAGKCAVITSYDPQAAHVSREETGAGTATDRQFIYDTYERLLAGVTARGGQSRTKTYEDAAKARFIKEPARMNLLIVVDKLLTGFDAPPCSFLYLDKRMRDHGLFQAICRTNRLDGDDKPYGVIVDYQDLFPRVRDAIAVYTEELDGEAQENGAPDIQVADRLARARENLQTAREAYALLCEPAQPPKGDLEFIQYFCGNSENPADLEETSPLRAALYQAIAALVRAHANLTGDMAEAGYSEAERNAVEADVDHAIKLRDLIRQAAGEHIDLKAYEADMRHLIDTYIQADPARPLSVFDEIPLLDLIVKSGIAEAVRERLARAGGNRDAIAETIENNVRATIIQEQLTDPDYFERMSALLDEVIEQRRSGALDYESYLKEIEQIARQVASSGADESWPDGIDTQGQRALYNNLGQDAELATRIDRAVKTGRPDGYVGDPIRERQVKQILFNILDDTDEVERVFALIIQHEEYR